MIKKIILVFLAYYLYPVAGVILFLYYLIKYISERNKIAAARKKSAAIERRIQKSGERAIAEYYRRRNENLLLQLQAKQQKDNERIEKLNHEIELSRIRIEQYELIRNECKAKLKELTESGEPTTEKQKKKFEQLKNKLYNSEYTLENVSYKMIQAENEIERIKSG